MTTLYRYIRKISYFSSLSNRSLNNIFWLLLDRAVRMGMGLLVGVWVARYLGPKDFGSLNYVISVVGIVSIFSTLGLDGILVNRILHFKKTEHTFKYEATIMGSAITLRVLGSFLSLLFVFIYFISTKSSEVGSSGDLSWVFFWISMSVFFQSFDTVKYFFEARVISKNTVIAFFAAFILSSACKVVFIYQGYPVAYFAFTTFLESILSSVFVLSVYLLKKDEKPLFLFSKKEALSLLKESWPLAFSTLAVLLYMKIDSVMIGRWLGTREVGIYGAALKMSEVWYFLPSIFVSTFFPRLFELFHTDINEFERKFTHLLRAFFWGAFTISILISFSSSHLIHLLYGNDYSESASILTIHIWTSIFVFWGVASNQWFIVNGLNNFLFYRTAWGALLNIVLNIILIPRVGAMGAAIATLISQSFVAFASDLLNHKTRPLFWLKIKAIL